MAPGDGGIGYRRNGKRQACEPCRKGKLACDHGAPHCGRCVRRKTTERCLYHPAPMTRKRVTETLAVPNIPDLHHSSGNSSGEIIRQYSHEIHEPHEPHGMHAMHGMPSLHTLGPDPSLQPSDQIDPALTAMDVYPTRPSDTIIASRTQGVSTTVRERAPDVDNWKTAKYPRSTFYQGPTSFSAVFSENRTTDSGDLLDIGNDTRNDPGKWIFGPPLLGRERPSAPNIRKKEVVKALGNLPAKDICESLLRVSCDIIDLTINPIMMHHSLKSFWSAFGAQLVQPPSADSMAVIADALFQNEKAPLSPTPEDGYEWLNTFNGTNIRFEMIGILFCVFGRAYLMLNEWDPLFKVPENSGRDRKETAWRMMECADTCLTMCHFSETVNEIVASLRYNIHVLESCCIGDEGYTMKFRHGNMVTCAVTAGLHRLPDYAQTKITTAFEYKKRLFAAIYYMDKTISILNGTPPLLSRLYCDLKPCLDLSDEEMFLPQHQLSIAISRLDSNGWNTNGEMYSATVMRGGLKLAVIREEILELALGVNIPVSEDRIAHMHYRCQHVIENLPPQLLYYKEGKIPKNTTGKTLRAQALLMLDFLQNKFLVERVAVARGFPNHQSLLNVAMEMLELTLKFWMMRDQLMDFTADFDWLITFYGIPSAGILCVELLKKGPSIQYPEFSRSDAIQKLTLFIGFLEWIRPTDGNYKLAGRLRKVVRRVLDHVLDAPGSSSDAPPSINSQFDPALLEIDSLNDMDWLSTIDWTHGAWIGP